MSNWKAVPATEAQKIARSLNWRLRQLKGIRSQMYDRTPLTPHTPYDNDIFNLEVIIREKLNELEVLTKFRRDAMIKACKEGKDV